MNHRCSAAVLIAWGGLAAWPARAEPAAKSVFVWPGPNTLEYFTSGLTRSGHAFFGSVETNSAPRQYEGEIFQLTQPAHPGGTWKTEVIYDFASQGVAGIPDFRTYGALAVDGAKRLYGFAYRTYYKLPSNEIFMLQPPASGTGAWTQSVVYAPGERDVPNMIDTPPVTDANGNLFIVAGGKYRKTCPADPQACRSIYKLVPDANHTSWTRQFIARFAGNPSLLVFDKAGNLFATLENPATYNRAVVELSPPPVEGAPWVRQTIWSSKPGQLQNLYGLTVGQDGNLLVIGDRPMNESGLFKLVRPATQTGHWIYRPIYIVQSQTDLGANPGLPLIDKSSALFFRTAGTVVRLSPPARLGQPWIPAELFHAGPHRALDTGFPMVSDSAGDLLVYGKDSGTSPGGDASPAVIDLSGTGFIPQQAPDP